MAFTDRIVSLFYKDAPQLNTYSSLKNSGWMQPEGGASTFVLPPAEFEGSSRQVCGFWPWSVGTSTPLIGAPLGRNPINGSPVCADPLTWYLAGIISSPSAFVLGLQGRGKSSLIVRMLIALQDLGFIPLISGDQKPDYAGLVRETGGQHVWIAPGVGGINPLDAGPLWKRIGDLPAEQRRAMEAEIHGRRMNTLVGLLEMSLKRPLSVSKRGTEVLSEAISRAARKAEAEGRQPLLRDITEIILAGSQEMFTQLLVKGEDEYREKISDLIGALYDLGPGGTYGNIFSEQTTEPMQLDKPVCFDISGIPEDNAQMRAAVQLVLWSYSQAGVSANKALADAGLEPERHHIQVMDELWQILQASELAVHRINAMTRLNRTKGLGQIMATHSMKDLTLSTPELTNIALGFVERSSMKFLGGLAVNEMPLLRQVFPVSQNEQDLLVQWSEEGTVDPRTGHKLPPPGRGHFMLKTGRSAGTPFKVNLTEAEHRIHDTNEAWAGAMRAAQR